MSLLVYGAYGYTGELVSREAVSRGRDPVLAGRRTAPLRDLATDLGCEARAFEVDRAVSRLRTPNTYAHTVDAALAAVERVRDGAAPEGYATPAGAFGSGFVLDRPGVEGFDDEPVRAGE